VGKNADLKGERATMKLSGKVALVTGGGRGLGRATAIAMARAGARVAVMSRSEGELKEVASIIERLPGEALVCVGDVSREEAVQSVFEGLLERFSALDILVNSAARIGPARFLEDADPASWREAMAVNLGGVYLCSRAALGIMAEKGKGKIINVISGLGQRGFPRFCAYGVSKAGVIQMTRALAEEFRGLNIQVNAIDPGVMDTGMQEEVRGLGREVLGDEIHARFRGFKEQGLLKDPARVAELVVFLASSDADPLTGHIGSLEYYQGLGWRG
jgi:NAD(P)-dependent dehydrogenase (short-subunit alcohol dehydrogenase family)